MPRRCKLDASSPFETGKVLDPDPDGAQLDEAKSTIAAGSPSFGNMEARAAWGGLIDVTPRPPPAISPAESLLGLVVATGILGPWFRDRSRGRKLAAQPRRARRLASILPRSGWTRFKRGAKPAA